MNPRQTPSRSGILLVLLVALLAAARPLRPKEPAPLTLLFTSDEYGYLEPCG